jgi:hypothetical protein
LTVCVRETGQRDKDLVCLRAVDSQKIMSTSRLSPYRAKPPADWEQLVAKMRETPLFLLQKQGPTRFVVRGQESDVPYTVHIGPAARCTCSKKEHCPHMLFVMIKVSPFGIVTCSAFTAHAPYIFIARRLMLQYYA